MTPIGTGSVRGLAAAAGVVLLAALLLVPAAAPACGCGPNPRFLVAHGTSPNGAPWWIRAEETAATRTSRRGALFHFGTAEAADQNGLGYLTGMGLPIPKQFVFSAASGDGRYPELEGDVSGIARPRAVRLVARMSDGSALEIETQRAPEPLRRRFPWLRGLTFFNQFYPADLEPQAIVAYGRDGRVLSRQPA